MKEKVKRILEKRPLRKKEPEKSLIQAIQGLPRITNETVAEHREEVLSSARKYIYPLQHSPHRVVIISSALLVLVLIGFFTYCLLALYKFHASSTFIYRVTQVIPFPVAKAGGRYVAYENYLFELRHYIHYYETQQKVDFSNSDCDAQETSVKCGKQQLEDFRKRALERVVDNAYIKELAKDNGIKVTDQELEDAIRLVRSQNRLGSNEQVFEDVLKEFWGWSVSDFKRELKQQILTQKVMATLDTATNQEAKDVHVRLQAGEDFAALARSNSDDPATKDNGGAYGLAIGRSDRNLPPQVIDVLFRLKPGEISGVVNTGTGLEVIKLTEVEGSKVKASHILFSFKPIDTYVRPLKDKEKPQFFINP
ncbi:MAG TPA: peptidylprolyl isomerase [Candidatus Saccharimonadales bacterium]|nr:peptidylprolyl isomerase [Candidatus Saccharimonadales bacterium]